MKFPAAYYLLLLYITVMIKPLIPLIQDVVAHQYNGIEHIIVVHAKYGSDHVQKALEETNADSNGENQNILKIQDQVSFHLMATGGLIEAVIPTALLQYHSFTPYRLPLIYLSNQGPPPKYS